jgi:sterol desaturase/sphingolipid hydroxylase (fatty acid hydroxylase superfamily)
LTPLARSWPVQIVVAFLAVDLYEYALHRLAHRFRPLWLMHAVHHGDPHVDSSTSFRHHPVEFAIAIIGRVLLYLALGLPLWIEIVRATAANAVILFQHANIDFPPWVEKMRAVLATPAFHRIHHDPDKPVIDRNFGQIFSFWDRLFGTWHTPEADLPREYGLRRPGDDRWQTLGGMLTTPITAARLGQL